MQNAKSKFEFTSFQLALDRMSISFKYKMFFGHGKYEFFEEKIVLPKLIPHDVPDLLLTKILFSLHLMLGISYYKVQCASQITIKSGFLNKEQAFFWETVYIKGLGEFFFRNHLDFRDLIHFPFVQHDVLSPITFERSDRSLLGIGGGKDSLVSYELLQKANEPFTSLVIESNHPYPIVNDLFQQFQISSVKVKRSINTKVFSDNNENAVFNGHIPISAINAFIGIFVCLIYDYRYFIVSNERSANVGNVTYLGMEVNHQWSKSIEFEQLFQEYIKKFITPSVIYFSLLRPFSELTIVKKFSTMKKYFSFFSSCNTNFKINKELLKKKWCNNCPKCAFVFCMLSAFLPKTTVVDIFGCNLYEDDTMLTLYRRLWGIEDIKPFECVGTPDEVKMAFYLCYQKKEFNNDYIMHLFEKDILPLVPEPEILLFNVLKLDPISSTIPKKFNQIIKRFNV